MFCKRDAVNEFDIWWFT